MEDDLEFGLKINGFTPETFPMSRLSAYMLQFSRLLGSEPKVHFVEVGDGSAVLLARPDDSEINRVDRRLQLIKMGEGTAEARTAYQKIDDLLYEDNTDAVLQFRKASVIQFPGKSRIVPPVYSPIVQADSLDGVLIGLGGKDDTVPIHLADGKAIYKCTASKSKAREMAHHIFGPLLRVYGTASWKRAEDGMWHLNSMVIEHFQALKNEPPQIVIDRLRAIPGNEWHTIPNTWEVLAELRGDDE